MTDLLEPYVAPPMDDLPPDPMLTADGDNDDELAPFLRYLLAACPFGAAAIHVAGVALWRPRLSAGWCRSAMVMASIIPVAALVVGSVAVASPSASGHAHGAGEAADGHVHSAAADRLGFSLLGNGHHHAIAWHDQDPVTQAELDRQIAITKEVAAQYPTVASVEAAGYKRAGPYSPGLGAHYTKSGAQELNFDGVVDD